MKKFPQTISESVTDVGDCRTAPATPGLLITYQGVKKICQQQGAEHSGKGDSCEAGHSCEGVKCEVKNKQKNMMAYDYN